MSKIALVCPEFPPDLWGEFPGGITRYAELIADGYESIGNEVHVFTRGHKRGIEVSAKGYFIHRYMRIRARSSRVLTLLGLVIDELALLVAVVSTGGRSWDVIEFIDWNTPGLIVSRIPIAKRRLVKLHGPTDLIARLNGGVPTGMSRLIAWRERAIAKRATTLIAASEEPVRFLRDLWRIDRPIPVVPDPVALPSEASFTGLAACHRLSDPVVLAVGRLEERKGQRYLVKACERLLDEGQALVVRFVGPDTNTGPNNSSYRSALEGEMRADIRMRVEFLGPLPHEALWNLYRDATVVVVTSVDGNYGYTTLDAMAAGACVISTREPSGGESLYVHDDSGILVPARDSDALAEALASILGDPEKRCRLGRTARDRVASAFSKEAIATATLQLM